MSTGSSDPALNPQVLQPVAKLRQASKHYLVLAHANVLLDLAQMTLALLVLRVAQVSTNPSLVMRDVLRVAPDGVLQHKDRRP
jgi:hypothetical protein